MHDDQPSPMERKRAADPGVRCWSWRVRAWRIVRCSWDAGHVTTSKWHCAERSTGHIWYVRDRERG